MISKFEQQVCESISELVSRYRGLRAEDLCSMNPHYSCCICSKSSCDNFGEKSCACPECEPATEEQFALNYDFT